MKDDRVYTFSVPTYNYLYYFSVSECAGYNSVQVAMLYIPIHSRSLGIWVETSA